MGPRNEKQKHHHHHHRGGDTSGSSQSNKMYTCVNCGHLSPQIYKTYSLSSENLMKLLNCKQCGMLVDKYIEYDIIIVAVNLLLLNQPAYKHALLNHPFEGYWKLGIIFTFFEAYSQWCFEKGTETDPDTVDYYALENDFYRALFRTLLGAFVFHGFIAASSLLRATIFPKKVSVRCILKGTSMCGFFSVFELIALVWSFPRKDILYVFLYGMQLLTNVQSYIATTASSPLLSYAVIGTALWLKLHVCHIYDENVPTLDINKYILLENLTFFNEVCEEPVCKMS